jgi:hypothetical protein
LEWKRQSCSAIYKLLQLPHWLILLSYPAFHANCVLRMCRIDLFYVINRE